MDDRTRIVSDEEFAAAVVDRASDLAYEGQGDLELLKTWARLCALPEPEDVGPVFWEGFVLGGAVVGLEIAGFGVRLRDKPSGPILELIEGGRDREVGKKCPN